MATSTKVMFKLEVLREKALESIDFRIAQAEIEVLSYDDDNVLAQRVKEWREKQEAKISDLFSKLGDGGIDDYQLSKFKLDSIPEVDRYDRQRAERKLVELRSRKTQIEAKSESLVGDADGNISLTKTQLSEFFDL